MIRRFKRWLVASFLPELASMALVHEVEELQRQLVESEEELQQALQDKARLQSYVYGMERALRSRQVNITIKGGAAIEKTK